MPNTYTSLHYHLVFSTRNREPWIAEAWRPRLFEYLGGSIRGMGGHPHEVGGVADQVHLALSLKPTHQLSKVLQELKKSSSAWIHKERLVPDFAWQDGYAAFAVSSSNLRAVVKYVHDQEEHHRERSFREELEILLKKSGVAFDPKYLE